MLTSSVVDRGFEPRSGQTKDYKIGIYCFSTKHAALKRKSKDWLALNKNNVSEQGSTLNASQRLQHSQRHSVINHCDRHITLLSDTDISFDLFKLFTYFDTPFG